MSSDPIFAQPPPLPEPAPRPRSPLRFTRVEYLGFQNLPEHREFRLAVYGPEGPVEFRYRIAMSAFAEGRVRLQDGPDVCYVKLLRAVAAGEEPSPDPVVVDDLELASYREAHTKVPKHRTWTAPTTPRPPFVPRPPSTRPRPAPEPVAPPSTLKAEAGLDEGQRVSHAEFGVGVTTGSSGGRTVVCFDAGGPKTFLTSLLELEVLSAPGTWETSPRGKNRLREEPLP